MKGPSFAVVTSLLFSCAVEAHELRPAYLELNEQSPGIYDVTWKTPMRGEFRLSLAPEFSTDTTAVTPVSIRQVGNAAVQRWRIQTSNSLRGQTVGIDGLTGTMTDALVRVQFSDGTNWVKRLTPAKPAAEVPTRPSVWQVTGEYFELGVEHILLGIDHLLFVLALLLITRGTGRLVKAITAFTLAHSITLGFATLGYVHLPPPPVEAVIALSVVFLALEVIHLRRGKECMAAQSPWIVALGFGLLHGFGFAGALAEIGLPQGQVPLALLFFNLGVEAGQLLFVAVVLTLAAATRRLYSWVPRWVELIPPYAIGSVAMFWVIERALSF